MMRIVFARQLVPVALVLGMLAGCAGTAKEAAVNDEGNTQSAQQAIAAAEAAIAEAKANEWIWRDTEKFLKEAQDAAAKGDNEAAISLANKARSQAEEAVNQYYLEQAKSMLNEASAVQGLSAGQQETLNEAQQAIGNADGRTAYDLLVPLLKQIGAAALRYEVAHGDSLWAISGRVETYNDPYQWPQIFKANRDQIADADLIYPGQTFELDRTPTASEVDRAVDHARNRGAWAIGYVEDSDRRFLSGGALELR